MIYGECPTRDINIIIIIIIGDPNDKIGREDVYRQITGKFSLHTESNDNFASLQRTVISNMMFNDNDIEMGGWCDPGYQGPGGKE
jgi:hypothetical protein